MTDPHNNPVTTEERAADRARFRRTLVQVLAVQLVALALLWWLQANFAG